MPIYEYLCAGCGKKTEVIQSFTQPPPKACPHCGGKLKKAFSAPAIQFKGSGFYITDYAAKSGGPAEKTEKAEKAESSEKAEKSEKTEKADKTEKPEKPAKKKESKDKKASD